MEINSTPTEHESLGALFRRLRLERSLDISDINKETRIPESTIRAIEADDYKALPAQAFARGFYSIYAKMFNLDPHEILQRFSEECDGATPVKRAEGVEPPSWQTKNLGTMTERPSITAGSVIGLSLLFIILLAAGLSWYAGFNPATYVSKWLRGLQESPAPQELQVTPPAAEPSQLPTQQDGQGTTSLLEPVPPAEALAPVPENIKYQLVAEFQEFTRATVTIDEETTRSFLLPAGTIETWQARKSILLELPATTTARLFLNGISIPIPPAKDDKITISIPEYLLD